MKFSFVLLSLLAGMGACSSKTDDVDPYASVTSFCAAWGKAACSATPVTRCSGADSATEMLTEACIASQQTFCEGSLSGVAGYSSENASECLSAVGKAYSDGKLTALEIATVRHRGEPCNHLIKGPQGVGDSCTIDDDCDTLKNYLCVMKSGVGTCEIPALVDNGTSCSAPAAACNPGFYCGGDAGDENCVQSKAVGKTCANSFECANGLECDATSSKCEAPVSQTNCTKDEDCTTNVCDLPAGLCVSSITLAPSEALCGDLR